MPEGLLQLGLPTVGALLFVTLQIAGEVGFRCGRHAGSRQPEAIDHSAVSTLTAAMLGLLAFSLSLSIGFAQSRFETRRLLVLQEANAIGTAWLRTKLIDGDEGRTIAAMIADYAHARLEFTTAGPDDDMDAVIARTDALQARIWQALQPVALRAPNTVTVALAGALNDMFDDTTAQRFAYASRVPTDVNVGLYFGSLLSIGALSYQFGLAGKRHAVLLSLLLLMLSGGMLVIVDLNQPRIGHIRADAAPLVWTIQGFAPP